MLLKQAAYAISFPLKQPLGRLEHAVMREPSLHGLVGTCSAHRMTVRRYKFSL